MAEVHGYVRMFLEDAPVRQLLARFIAVQGRRSGITHDYLATIAQALEPVESASDREVEVLRCLAAGKQNQEIASELYVSLNTVKKHLTHIFDKLGVSNRTEASVRARDQCLVS